jgi:hypothetical protein
MGNRGGHLEKISDDRNSGLCGIAVAAPALAAEFYVVRDATTKKCTIVDTKPTTTTTTIVDNGIFKTKTEAETGMKTMKVCTTN